MLVVVALGGNALLKRGEPPSVEAQRANLAAAVRSLAALSHEHNLVITHGNGPQIGYLALQSAGSGTGDPLDVLGAETDGMIGYLIEQELAPLVPEREVATLLTQTVVDPGDPAFKHPTKPVGPVYEEDDAKRIAAEHGWTFANDGGKLRRVVPSPEPQDFLELRVIRRLVDAGVIVIAAGGGGIPVALAPSGEIRGAEAVVDKDLASALLAQRLGADALLLLTDVSAVQLGWGTPRAAPICAASPAELRRIQFAPGRWAPRSRRRVDSWRAEVSNPWPVLRQVAYC